MTTHLLELVQLSKSYSQKPVLQGLNLSMEENELLVLMGVSGCGKSTTLRLIAGLDQVDQGSILFQGKELKGVLPHQRDLGMVFQSGGAFEHRTVRQNFCIALESLRLSRSQVSDRIAWIASLLQLEPLLDRYPLQLSGGQQQRVSLGRGLIRQSKLILLDEPLSHLDSKLRYELQSELISLRRKLGISMLYVTHDPQEAISLADRIAILSDGVIQQCDTPLNVYHHPSNVHAAESLGHPPISIVDTQLIRTHSSWSLQLFGKNLEMKSESIPECFRTNEDPRSIPVRLGMRATAWKRVHGDGGCSDWEWVVNSFTRRYYGEYWIIEGKIDSYSSIRMIDNPSIRDENSTSIRARLAPEDILWLG